VRLASLALLVVGVLEPAAAAAQAAPERSIGDRLEDRRYVTTGPQAYVVGTQDGRFPAMGFHTRGEMGGVWAPPVKLLDGVWFGIDGRWLGRATRFTSGYGYVRMALPGRPGLEIERTELAPDDRRGVLFGLRFRAPGGEQRFTLDVDAHSELMRAYPWGETKPSQTTVNDPDAAAADAVGLVFTEPDGAAAAVGAARPAVAATGEDNRGPQDPARICPASGPDTPDPPRRCDDTAYGEGAGGRLRYDVVVPAGGEETVWIGVAGSEEGGAGARAELARLLTDPAAALRAKVAERERLAGYSRLELPGDPRLATGIDWSKQNLADSVQDVRDLEIRETNAGTRYPAPEGTLARARFLGAGWPDYPWLFGTDGEYTAFASVAVGQFEPIMDHLRALRDVSLIDNGSSGKVVHEVVFDGSVYFGSNRDAGNTDETSKFPSAVALLWRWTGDDAFRDEMYAFARSNLRYVFRELDADRDGWPEGLGNVEREGMGEEKLDNAVYTIRGLYDLADMASSKGDRATERWALRRARRAHRRFDGTWWMPRVPQHADSLGERNRRSQQRHWIGATPMEVELTRGGRAVPGLTSYGRGVRALRLRQTRCFGDRWGMFHTGRAGCDGAGESASEEQAFTLNTAIAAVGEGNYSRLGAGRQGHWTRANWRLQLRPDEQPGAMPEIAPSPLAGRTIDRPLNERPMVLQAWGAYGTAWPVVHQHLGVRPDLGRGRLEIVPQVPPGQPSVGVSNLRLGSGALAGLLASRTGSRRRTVVDTGTAPVRRVDLGVTLRRGERVRSVRLDGRRVRGSDYRLRRTNRGLELTVRVGAGRHVVEVRGR